MAISHGKRVYIQVLLEPNRGELFLTEAEALGVKPSALIRQIVYDYLAEKCNMNAYVNALTSDKEEWQASVNARLEGRAIKRRERAHLAYRGLLEE